MKIAHITTSLINAGAEAAMYRLIRANSINTHIVISLTGSGHYESLLKNAGITVHCLQLKGVGIPIKPLLEMRKILKAENPDIVQTWMYHANFFGGLVARSLRLKAVFWNLRTSNAKKGSYSKSAKIIKLISAKLAYLVPLKIISCAHKATSTHIAIGYPEHKIQTICNGYDMSYLNYKQDYRDEFRAQWQVSDDTLLIGLVARWHPQKNHELLFKSLNKMRSSVTQPWKLILVGPNMEYDNSELLQMLKNSQLLNDCILAGPQGDIPMVMSALDLHVLTSIDEGFPNVIAEAMACLTPCVSTDAGDAGFIIGDTGWISPTRDIEGLSHNLSEAFKAFTDKDQWTSLSIRARQRIQNEFSIEKMTNQYQDVWQQSTGRGS